MVINAFPAFSFTQLEPTNICTRDISREKEWEKVISKPPAGLPVCISLYARNPGFCSL